MRSKLLTKVLASFVGLIALVMFTSIPTEAKKMGSGNSVGKQSNTVTKNQSSLPAKPDAAPVNSAGAAKPAAPAAAPAAPAAQPSRFGGMGGILGGIAAGIGLSYLFSHMGLGGLGHMGLKFAHALGAETTVFSHSPEKEADAKSMGADHFVVTKDLKNLEKLNKSYDLILNTVSADLDLEPYLQLLKLDGTLVVIGLPGKPYSINAGTLLGQRRSLAGSMIGGIAELQQMLNFCGEHNIVSDVEVIKSEYINTAYDRTVASDVKYRFVIDAKTF